MASMQRPKPAEQTNNGAESAVIFKAQNEHPLTSMIKEMANSAYKMFTEQQHNHNGHVQKPAAQPGSRKGAAKATKTGKKKKDGQGGNFITNIGDHIMNMTKKTHGKAGKRNKGSSSEDDSDKETSGKKNKK